MDHIINIGAIPQEDRHTFIFSKFDSAKMDEAVVLQIDHDPKPLYFQFLFERAGQFSWDKTLLQDGSFRICITRIEKANVAQKQADEMDGCSCRNGREKAAVQKKKDARQKRKRTKKS